VLPADTHDVPGCLHNQVALQRQTLKFIDDILARHPEELPILVSEQGIVAQALKVKVVR
jgi:hypothetical protein